MGNDLELDNLNIVLDQNGKHKIILRRSNTMKEFVGDKLEDFEEIKKLGAGCFGEVWKVKSKITNKEYAMKKLNLVKEKQSSIKKEIEILKEVHHPNIVKFYTSFEKDNMMYIVIEYIDGKNLDEIISEAKEKKTYLPEKLVWKIMLDLLSGLTYLHEEVKIIHRDIKPDNILITKDNKVKITDFGISAINREDVSDTVKFHNSTMGPILFMAPEIGNQEYDFKADVWMLGLTFVKLMSWEIPYGIFPLFGIRVKIKNISLPDFYSEELRNVVLKMHNNNPEERPTSKQALEETTDIYKKKYIKFSPLSTICRLLSKCKLFYDFILSEGGKIKKDNLILYQFYLVFKQIQNNNDENYENQIKEFRMLLGANKSRFMGFGEVSTTLLIHYIIPQMHEELCKNSETELSYFNSESCDEKSKIDRLNKSNFFKYAIKEFDENYKCEISKLFYGMTLTKETCDVCNKTRYFIKALYFMLFPLKRASNHFDSKNLSVSQLFEHYEKKRNFVPGYCPNCKKKEEYVREIIIEKPPKIFLMSLDREDSEDDIKISVPKEFDMSKYLSSGKKIYNLVGVVIREKNNEGYFYSCILNDNGKWKLYKNQQWENASLDDLENKVIKIIIYQEQ